MVLASREKIQKPIHSVDYGLFFLVSPQDTVFDSMTVAENLNDDSQDRSQVIIMK